MARISPNFPDRSSPGFDHGPAYSLSRPPVRAIISQLKALYVALDSLECAYKIECEPGQTIQSIETSVIWKTDGKGDEDIGVHFFERRKGPSGDTRLPSEYRLSTVLPPSPLTYEGFLVKISWCVRIRIFLASGYHQSFSFPFKLHSGHGEAKILTPLKVVADDE